LNLSL